MKSGQLRHIVTFHRKTNEQNALGQSVANWQAITGPIHAGVVELSGRELERARQLHAEANYTVLTRYTAGLVTDRIHYGTRILEIVATITDERSRSTTYYCVQHKTP